MMTCRTKEGGPMISIPKIVGVMSCGFLLCLGLSGCAASARDEMKAGQSGERIGGQAGLKGEQEKLEGVADQSAEQPVATPCGSNYTCLKDTAFQYRQQAEQLSALAQHYEIEAEEKARELGQDAEQVKRNHDLAM